MNSEIRGTVKGNRTLVRDYGNTPIDEITEPIGFNESVRIVNSVLEKEYPAISKSLKVDRGDGIITTMLLQDKLNRKFEKNVHKEWDEDQVKRNEKYYDKVVEFNKKRADEMRMMNPERAKLLPIQVFNSLRAFSLMNYPINEKGQLLMDVDRELVNVGKKQYFAFNRFGNINPLKFPVLLSHLKGLDEFQGMEKRHLLQIPEVKILRSYILSRGDKERFNRDLHKIYKYQKNLTNPKKLVGRILSKLDKIEINDDNLETNDYNTFIGPADKESVSALSRVLNKENLKQVAPYPQKLRKYFSKYLHAGKLKDEGKEKFADFMQIYPKKIDRDYNL
jgi:hypothetical protein